MTAAELLDRLTGRAEAGEHGPPPRDWDASGDPLAAGILRTLRDPHRREEHRRRIHEDLVAARELMLGAHGPALLDLIVWSEHVESLYEGLKRGRLKTFHYVRALEATCRRCGFELLPLMGRMEELGKHWGNREYEATLELIAPQLEAESG